MNVKTIFLAVLLTFSSTQSFALSSIRDEESERLLREIATPIFYAAGLEPDNVSIIIVQSPEINAYVSGGMNIFLHTALLTFSDDPMVIAGVIAHETGHISGGHLSRLASQADRSGTEVAAGYILGLATAITASPELGQAIMLGSEQIVGRSFLKFTRTQEESADQAGIGFLNKSGYSGEGLLALLKHFKTQERGFGNLNPYLLTHPLSGERITLISQAVEKTPRTKNTEFDTRYTRMVGKLRAFLEKPKTTFRQYPPADSSIAARYARAIAYYRIPDLTNAFKEIDSLIAQFPNDPYFEEMKGQILFENGRIKESIEHYQKALKLLPDSALIQVGLAASFLATEQPENLKKAEKLLTTSLQKDHDNPFAWNQLAIAYGKQNNLGQSYVALTEQAALQRNKKDVDYYNALAKKHLPEGSPGALRVDDIKEEFLEKK